MQCFTFVALLGFFSFTLALADEPQCSKFHYESNTLERIISTEFEQKGLSKDVKLIQTKREKIQLDTNEGKSTRADMQTTIDTIKQELALIRNEVSRISR